jgi:hypothetical protein
MIHYRFYYTATEREDMTLKQVRRQLKIQDAWMISILDDNPTTDDNEAKTDNS